jgi:signal transduction histidine kinase
MVALPMIADGQFVGVLYGALRQPAAYGDAVLDTLQRVADGGAEQIYAANRLEEHTESAVTAERSRIAAGLHDSVGAMLFSTGAELRALQADSSASPELVSRLRAIEQRLAETASLFRQSLAALDDAAPRLRLAAALIEDCRSFESRTGVPARCVAVTALPVLSAEGTAALIGLAREALLNVEKHARASSVVVSLAALEDRVTLAVADDGAGWDPDGDPDSAGARHPWSSHIGLRAARARLERIGGSLSVVENEDGGLTVRAQVSAP